LHPGSPVTLGEDFCGAAAIAHAWAGLGPRFRAVAVDRDPDALLHAPSHPRLRLVGRDVRRVRDKVDVLCGFNFAACELHTRGELLGYLRNARRRLRPRGLLALDLYGGATAWVTGEQRRTVALPRALGGGSGVRVEYTWEQRSADASTGMVENAVAFRVTRRGAAPLAYPEAFVYRWRLWGIAELRDAMAEAGFEKTEVHDRLGGALDGAGRPVPRPVFPGEGLDDDYVAYVVGRA
jgi:SAM-dependent methyltransferase